MRDQDSAHLPVEAIIEALLHASPEPLAQSAVDACFPNSPPSLEQVATELNIAYKSQGRAVAVERVAGGFRLVTRPEFAPWIRRLGHFSRRSILSRPALETLTVVAYKGPISKPEIDSIRGVDSSSVLVTLLDRKLVEIRGRGEGPGRPLLYSVTPAFLKAFGIDRLGDLPKLKEISELAQSGDGAVPADSEGDSTSEPNPALTMEEDSSPSPSASAQFLGDSPLDG